MSTFIWIIVVCVIAFFIIKKLKTKENRTTSESHKVRSNKKPTEDSYRKSVIRSSPNNSSKSLKNKKENYSYKTNLKWASEFLDVSENTLNDCLQGVDKQYKEFKLRKRKGGFRTISAPSSSLLSIQRIIATKILSSAQIHEAAKGYKENTSVLDNAQLHLGNEALLKVDLMDFFGSIKRRRVADILKKIGFSKNKREILTNLCVLDNKLPQGAATSPIISNIVSYDMDVALSELAEKNKLKYTRYADDLTFSGSQIPQSFYVEVEKIVRKERFAIQLKKTRFLHAKSRKIITGVSISSGEKATMPKGKKREIRKNVYFILKNGLAEHQQFIKSSDPVYLKRLIGQLNFWLMIEPDNEYVQKSIAALRKITVV